MNTDTLRQWITGHLQGRSWNWLGRQLEEPVSGTTVRNWADGKYALPPFRADQIAAVFDVDPDEVRAVAGLELKGTSDGNTAAKTLPVYGIGPETGRLIYRTSAAADDIEVTVDAAPGDHVDIDELVARMEEIAADTARVMALMRQAARDAHNEFNHNDTPTVGRDQ